MALLGAVLVATGWLVLGRDATSEPLPVYWSAPQFALLDQEADSVRSADLRGTVWVVNFFFTNCTGVCPLVNARMALVRDSLQARGLLGRDVRLISISVDPGRDTPPVLREYAEAFGGSPSGEWAFLTGSPPERVRRLIQTGFRVTAVDPGSEDGNRPEYQVAHSPRMLLVDREGRIRGSYDGRDAGVIQTVLDDVVKLVAD